MEFDTTTEILNPATSLNDPTGRFPHLSNIAYVSACATRRPGFHDYSEMIISAYNSISALLIKLINAGYRPYIFIVGAALTPKMIDAIPHYDLWAKARRHGLKAQRGIIDDLFIDGRRRRLGLYEIRAEDLLVACHYQSQANACVIALSKDSSFLSKIILYNFYRAAQPDEDLRIIDIRWYHFICMLCEENHVMLQQHGLFDDLERSLTLCMSMSTWSDIA